MLQLSNVSINLTKKSIILKIITTLVHLITIKLYYVHTGSKINVKMAIIVVLHTVNKNYDKYPKGN